MKTLKRLKGISLLAGLASMSAATQPSGAALVPIDNPSFESPSLTIPGSYTWPGGGHGAVGDGIDGWTYSGIAGVYYPGGGNNVVGPVPDGKQVAMLDAGGTVSQTLAATVQPNTTYTLSVQIGGWANGDYNPGTAYSIHLLAGSTLLASVVPVTPPTGTWTTLTATFTSGSAVPQGNLGIAIANFSPKIYYQLDFDNVQLEATAVPEPSTWITALLMLGLTGLHGFPKFRGTPRPTATRC